MRQNLEKCCISKHLILYAMTESENRPMRLVFVRHGESRANIVQTQERLGDISGYTEEFRSRANADVELSERGVEQAKAAGIWIRENINNGYFDGYYVSSFRRALQTAGHLRLPEAANKKVWKIRDYMREQSWGYFDNMPRQERDSILPQINESRNRDRQYWAPLGGESMADLVFRAKIGIIQTLYREVADGSGIAVSHGNLLWAVRIVMEGLTTKDYDKLDNKNNPLDKMNNCQILEYTRIDPSDPTNIANRFTWMRTVCPWDTTLSRNQWQQIRRPKYTNEELLNL